MRKSRIPTVLNRQNDGQRDSSLPTDNRRLFGLGSCWTLVGCLLLLLFCAPIGHASGGEAANDRSALALSSHGHAEEVAEVIRVIDGDTIEVRLDGRIQTVRYLGVDAPEIDWAAGQHQEYALDAAQANRELVSGERVRLVFDTTKYDIYGRLLAHVFVGDMHVNYRLIERGYAQAMFVPPNLQFQAQFLAAQREACRLGRGIWAALEHPIAVRQTAAYVGTFQIVAGHVVHGQQRASDGVVELVLRDDSSGAEFLYVHIYPESRIWFESPPEEALVDLRVQVVGLIEHYGRSQRIVVRDPAMLVAVHRNTTDVVICGRRDVDHALTHLPFFIARAA